MTFPAERIRALRLLHEVATAAGWRCVLIGASALELLISSDSSGRVTSDADAIVSVRTWDDYEALRHSLEARGFRRGRAPHQMFSPEGGEIDLIPFGEDIVVGHQIIWPNGARMSALGLAEALETATPEIIEGDFTLDVVRASTFVLLKLISYQDRPADRRRDVADIVVMCEQYESESDRRYEVDAVVDGIRVSFDHAGAFVLGRDIREVARDNSLDAAARFFARIPDHYAIPVKDVLTEERRMFLADERTPQIFRLFRVLQAGMGLASPSAA
jgi:predicted nucleotidyltransferase